MTPMTRRRLRVVERSACCNGATEIAAARGVGHEERGLAAARVLAGDVAQASPWPGAAGARAARGERRRWRGRARGGCGGADAARAIQCWRRTRR